MVVPRGDFEYVITEYGKVNLFGKSLQERAIALISISHPDYRDELFNEAQKMGLINKDRTLSEAMIYRIYPLKLEEKIIVNNINKSGSTC